MVEAFPPKTPDSKAPESPDRNAKTFVAPRGSLEVRVWRDGHLIEHTRDDNLIVTGSKFIHAQLLGGMVAGNSVGQVGFGSNAAPAALGNTSLSVDAYVKAVDAITYPSSNQVAFAISLGSLEAQGLSLAEYGLLTASGLLYSRLVRAAPLVKDGSVVISSIWTITF